MGWDERVFGWFWRLFRGGHKAQISEQERAREALLTPRRERLRLLASALAETSIDIREAEHEGGFSSSVLFLPPAIRFAATREDNDAAYTIRVAAAVFARKYGFAIASTEPMARAVGTLLVWPTLRTAMLEECSGARDVLLGLERSLLGSRPDVMSFLGARRAYECAVRMRLGDTAPILETIGPGERDWISSALQETIHTPIELERGVHALTAALRALGGDLAGLELPAIWGPVGTRDSSEPDSAEPAAHSDGLSRGTELRFRPKERIERVELPKTSAEDNPIVHTFEKVHTAEEYQGGNRTPDGSDEIQEQRDAIDELDLRAVVRTTERASSLMRCDVMMESPVGDLAPEDMPPDGGIFYDEWYEKERSYRPRFCQVRVTRTLRRRAASEARQVVDELRTRARRQTDDIRAELLRIEQSTRWRSRQLDGPEIDEDAVALRVASLRSGHDDEARLYRAKLRHDAELAVLILVDASLSTDAWIDGQRVLDVELESTLALADALDGLDIELGIATFQSHTRRDCRFSVVKDFRDRWEEASLSLASIEPDGYTRIGPALRHATTILSGLPTRRRLLLLLTDGKPNDYDRYEGTYGVADVRQAVREAERTRVHIHALAFDREARFHLPRMFSPSRHAVVSAPTELSRAMGRVCIEMQR